MDTDYKAIKFQYISRPRGFRNTTLLKCFIASFFRSYGKQVESVSYIFCSDDYLLKINQEFLKHDYYTDIITFDLSEKESTLVSEIYISIDRVRDNASSFKISFLNELHRVIFHGALHLVGYKDKSKMGKSKMRQAETHLLSEYFVSRETNSKS